MNRDHTTGPVEKVMQAQTNLTYIEGLAGQRRISRKALKKAISDTQALLDALSRQLQQRSLT